MSHRHLNGESFMPVYLPTDQDTERFARRLATCIQAPLVLTFSGDIGAGKTTLVRALFRALGVDVPIKSPTFSLVESYQGLRGPLHHFDLYRIQEETELDHLGFRDYFEDNAICCIEWPERVQRYQRFSDLGWTLSVCGSGRDLEGSAWSASGLGVLSLLAGE